MQDSPHITENPWEKHLEMAVRAARNAGEIQIEAFDKTRTIDYKGETNLVTEVDRACEEAIFDLLSTTFPSHDFLLEETPTSRSGSPHLWVVDPLDGTTNYTHRYPHFCCSIALLVEGRTVLGVVFDPVRDELFTALRSSGAFLNESPDDIGRARDKNLRKFARLLQRVRSVRRSGSAALDLCYVAAGRLDGYWILKLAPWDTAAGVLMVEEAGGCVTGLHGGPTHLYTKALVASNGRIQESLLTLLSGRTKSG